jgi:hypothetical protein
MQFLHVSTILLSLLACLTLGCTAEAPVPPSQKTSSAPLSSSEREELLDAVKKAEDEARNAVPPPPKVSLATPEGWTRTEPRPLPPADNGFTVGYEHESGLAVTVYQYTRGLEAIPDELSAPAVQEVFQLAKSGIEQAVQLGYWKAANEVASDIVPLGDSSQKALWSQYNLTMDGMTLTSDIYVWSHANTFFKLRCTCRFEEEKSRQEILRPLLTAFGSPIVGVTQ